MSNLPIKITKAWGTYDRNGNLLPNAGPKQTDYTPVEVVIIEQNQYTKELMNLVDEYATTYKQLQDARLAIGAVHLALKNTESISENDERIAWELFRVEASKINGSELDHEKIDRIFKDRDKFLLDMVKL